MFDRLAHVPFRGAIRERKVEQYRGLFRQLARARRIRGVLLDLSSGGGEQVASRQLYREVARLNETKPVVASIGSAAASGGYLGVLGARKVFAYPESLVGSIGVVYPHLAVRGLLEKLGVEVELLHAGRHKDAYQGVRPLDDEERAKVQAVLDDGYQEFVATVAGARRRPVAEILPLATGEFWSGRRALALGLIDALGDRDDALAELARWTGVDSRRTITVAPYRPFLERMLGGSATTVGRYSAQGLLEGLDELRFDPLAPPGR